MKISISEATPLSIPIYSPMILFEGENLKRQEGRKNLDAQGIGVQVKDSNEVGRDKEESIWGGSWKKMIIFVSHRKTQVIKNWPGNTAIWAIGRESRIGRNETKERARADQACGAEVWIIEIHIKRIRHLSWWRTCRNDFAKILKSVANSLPEDMIRMSHRFQYCPHIISVLRCLQYCLHSHYSLSTLRISTTSELDWTSSMYAFSPAPWILKLLWVHMWRKNWDFYTSSLRLWFSELMHFEREPNSTMRWEQRPRHILNWRNTCSIKKTSRLLKL